VLRLIDVISKVNKILSNQYNTMKATIMMMVLGIVYGDNFEYTVPAIGTTPDVIMYSGPTLSVTLDYDFHPVCIIDNIQGHTNMHHTHNTVL